MDLLLWKEELVPDLHPSVPGGARIGVGSDFGVQGEDTPLPVEEVESVLRCVVHVANAERA